MAIKVVFFDIGDTLVGRKKWMPGAREAVQTLLKARVRVGLISNTGNLSREQLAGLLPDDFSVEDFEQGIVLLSSEVGVEKPSLSIFLLAVQHAGVSPWETMFVGESLTESIAAQAAGMRAARIGDSAKDYPDLIKVIVANNDSNSK